MSDAAMAPASAIDTAFLNLIKNLPSDTHIRDIKYLSVYISILREVLELKNSNILKKVDYVQPNLI
jgi:hypothetical protein